MRFLDDALIKAHEQILRNLDFKAFDIIEYNEDGINESKYEFLSFVDDLEVICNTEYEMIVKDSDGIVYIGEDRIIIKNL